MALTFIKRPATQRGQADFGWLQSHHSFSFGNYYDPAHMGFGNLRVINDDIVQAGKGFGLHPHQNAEIFSYVLDGALEHKDTLGNGSEVKAGGIQFMSAGSGISHSEYNPSKNQRVRFLQIWLLPMQTNTQPYYKNMDINPSDKDGKLALFLSFDGRNDSIKSNALADVYCATLNASQVIEHQQKPNKLGWVQVANGSLVVNEQLLEQGDGLAVTGSGNLRFSNANHAEFLYFEMG